MLSEITFSPGDVVRVHQKIKEIDKDKEKTRIQVFEGVVIGIKGRGENKMFTVRKVVDRVAVEKIWPMKSLNVDKVEIKAKPKDRIRRSKLYYLRKNNK